MTTISDVAARAGVSTATVSRALNGKSTVDPDLVLRVQRAASALGYRPNGLARSLRKQETLVIALIIADVENPFFTAIARGAEDTAQAAGYSVVLCNSDEDEIKERRYVDVAVQEQAAGVVISPAGEPGNVGPLLESRTPVVAVDRPLTGLRCDTILVDTRTAARQATMHLVEQGYERIACITGPAGVSTADDRLAGYRDGLRAAKRRTSASLVRRCGFKVDGARQASDDLLDQPNPPDAVLTANNLITVGLLEALTERKLRVGRDIGIVAFDDAPWATLVRPALTVVSQPAYDMGCLAIRMLLARLESPGSRPKTTTLQAELVVRGSSRRR